MLNISLGYSQPFYISQLRILCLSLYPMVNLVVSLGSTFLNSLYILDINPLFGIGLVMIFSKSVFCHLAKLTKGHRDNIQINKIKNEKGGITTEIEEIKKSSDPTT